MVYNVEIEGMMCGMCEAHVNDAIRKNFDVKKVKANHKKNLCVIKTDNELNVEKLEAVIKETGYTFKGVTKED
ncbi:MAG: cation transporter [Lachnospiraceae bacterium]|nr:cation transporter [Lachnospiraceae bacterium]